MKGQLLIVFIIVCTASSEDVIEIIGGSKFDNVPTSNFVSDIEKFISQLTPYPDLTITYRPICGGSDCSGKKAQLAKSALCAQEYISGNSLPSINFLYANKNAKCCDYFEKMVGENLGCPKVAGPIAENIRNCATSAEGDKLVKNAQKQKPQGKNGNYSIVINGNHVAGADLPKNVAEFLCPLDSIRDYQICADVICVSD